MARSVWKPPIVDDALLRKVKSVLASGKINVIIKTWSRRSVIIPEFVGLVFGVYNGKKFIPVQVKEDMVNHRLGEFSPTRTYHGHGDKKVKKG